MSERRSPTEERLTPPKCLNYSSASPTSSGYLGRPSPQAAPESPRGKPTARNFPPELGAPLLESAARGWEESERSGQESEPQRESALATHGKAAVYGLINAVVVAPVMIGFAAIIFRHPAFHADAQMYSRLVKLVIFSSTVHQIAFSASSSLDFAIGQVQDAGLIFLSKMSGDIAEAMKDDHPDAMVATTLVGLSLSTALLGVALIITGKLQLAMLVQVTRRNSVAAQFRRNCAQFSHCSPCACSTCRCRWWAATSPSSGSTAWRPGSPSCRASR